MNDQSGASGAIDLSVIVVNWNVRNLLQDCLRSVIQSMHSSAYDWELFVVDNASSDGSADMVRYCFPQAHLITNDQNIGFARANNQAFLQCRGEFVLLLNPDTIVLDNAIDSLLKTVYRRPNVAVVGCRMVGEDGTVQRWTGGSAPTLRSIATHFLYLNRFLPRSWTAKTLYLVGDPIDDRDVGWVSGACMLIRRKSLDKTIFGERFFMYGEDMELCLRLGSEGWKVTYVPRATIVHYDGASIRQQGVEGELNKLRNLRYLFAERHGPRNLFLYDVLVVAGFLLRTVANIAIASSRSAGTWLEVQRSVRYLKESLRAMISGREI
jgi:N-acetylglucosaminyl-diphospho-decaprenol L-rhamnosyltransferase